MQRGLYPGSWHKGALGVGAGKIQDDASNVEIPTLIKPVLSQ